MDERKLSKLQREYRAFFLEKMMLYDVKSPAELTRERKSEFFTEIRNDWSKYKLSKLKLKHTGTVKTEEFEEPLNPYFKNSKKATDESLEDEYASQALKEQTAHQQDLEDVPQIVPTRTIKSEPNPEQKDDLRILFTPNAHFLQIGQYQYPVVKMPRENSLLKLPRAGRSNQKGYKEDEFFNQLKHRLTDVEMDNNVHMVIPNFNKPYEPDIVLFDKRLNLFIDIEIDEPYDGFYRYPTHYINPEDAIRQDNIRDLFFTESGWIVIRFTEKQVHCQTNECIDHIKDVLSSLKNRPFTVEPKCEKESQWDYNQCIQWQKFFYREKYLGIDKFKKQYSYTEIRVDAQENESIETLIERTKKFQFDSWSNNIAFDEESHKYLHPKDQTGNAEYISVTTLIERFFPFDLRRYIERKAEEENRTEDEVLDEFLLTRDEASEKGTFLHNQIESYLKGKEFDSDSKEFKLFLEFIDKEIKRRNVTFFDAEKIIFSDRYNVAGTIDCLFKKNDKDEYVMLDWKRSKKLVINGNGEPDKRGFQIEVSGLTKLNNCSYYRYCLQQNIYKEIIEYEYSIKISSMHLVVLHERYDTYHLVRVPELKKESHLILNSLKVKI